MEEAVSTRMSGIHHISAVCCNPQRNLDFYIATGPPGFTVDKPPEEVGTLLKLRSWLEPRRNWIEAQLPPLRLLDRVSSQQVNHGD